MSITAPNQISTQGNVEVGDTIEFINKFNAFQTELSRFSGEANQMAIELNTLVSDFTALVTQSEQQIDTAVAGHSSDLSNQANTSISQIDDLKSLSLSQMGDLKSDTINAANQLLSEMNTLVTQVEQLVGAAQQIVAGDIIDDTTPGSNKVYSSTRVEERITAIQSSLEIPAATDGGVLTSNQTWVIPPGISASLPTSPSAGDQIQLIPGGDWITSPATILRNTRLIWGIEEDLILNELMPLIMTYKSDILGWEF